MTRQALNTYLEPEQKAELERLAKRRKVSQATLVRQALREFMRRETVTSSGRPPTEAWSRILKGYYSGTGAANDPDDIYR